MKLAGPKPEKLHVPQFTYAAQLPGQDEITPTRDDSDSKAFAFSAFFQSSPLSAAISSLLQPTPRRSEQANKSILRETSAPSFIGFSWGPSIDAFDSAVQLSLDPGDTPHLVQTPHVVRQPFPGTPLVSKTAAAQATPQRYPFMTPMRPSGLTPFRSLPRPSTVQRTVQRRAVSDREAMKQLVNCVGMSARKKVLESGRKPRILTSGSGRSRSSTLKELRFDRSVMVVHGDSGVSYRMDPTGTSESGVGTLSFAISASATSSVAGDVELFIPSDTDGETESDAPPSPSPSPRPGSAMSMLSKRSQTPTATSFNLLQPGYRGGADGKNRLSPTLFVDPAWPDKGTQDMATSVAVDRTLSYDALDDLQRRHEKLMQNILGITGRLENISTRINNRL